jgi:hypothetical protein
MIEAAAAANLVHLVILAGAFSLDQDGTIAALCDQIEAHLQLDKTRCALAHQPHFAGLFGGGPVALKCTRQATPPCLPLMTQTHPSLMMMPISVSSPQTRLLLLFPKTLNNPIVTFPTLVNLHISEWHPL